MPELTTEQRNKLKPSDFAYVDQQGEGHLPIHDAAHVRNAIARWGRTEFESKAARAAARTTRSSSTTTERWPRVVSTQDLTLADALTLAAARPVHVVEAVGDARTARRRLSTTAGGPAW